MIELALQLLPVAAIAAALAFGFLSSRAAVSGSRARLRRFAEEAGYATKEAPDPNAIVLVHEEIAITLGVRGGADAQDWKCVLYAQADWALGAGPSFVAVPRDETSYTHPANGAVPLRARVERSYELTGAHREARRLLTGVLERTSTNSLTTPRFSGTERHVQVELPGYEVDLRGDAEVALTQLVLLTSRLALNGVEVLRPYVVAIGGELVTTSGRRPALFGRFRREGLRGTLELGWSPFGYELRLGARRAGKPPPLATAIAGIEDAERRALAGQICRRALVQEISGDVVLVIPSLPDPDELEAVLEVLGLLAGARRTHGPFR